MKNHLFRRILSLLLVAALLAGYYVPGAQAASTGLRWEETDRKVEFDMTDRKAETHVDEGYAPTDIVRVSIVLEKASTMQAGFRSRLVAQNDQAMAYNRQLVAEQEDMAEKISKQALGGKPLDVVWNLTVVGNIISANVPYGKIPAIERVKGVLNVFVELQYEPCVVQREENTAQPQMFSSLGMAGSYQVWTNGYTGAGSRIAVIDTGTDIHHQSLDAGAFLYALEQNAKAEGISYSEYVKKLELLDEQEIAAVLDDLKISQKISGLTASDLYIDEKLAFGANYVDDNLNVQHIYDEQGEHGSHVAGIATANRYIPRGNGYAEALDTVLMAGMAPDAQLITMKVFGQYSPYESDYMAAIEDAILLNCDSVNLSLGSSVAGAGFSTYYGQLLQDMTSSDTVVVASAGNSYSWPMASTFGYLYSEDVNLDTVGSPGSYSSFFTVASVNNDGGVGDAFRVGGNTIAYADSAANGYCYPLSSLDRTADNSGTEYDYIFIDGLGDTADYSGMDLQGKIVFCSRGSLNFAVKANNAVGLGAEAVIIYNNDDSGLFGMNLDGYRYYDPCVSIAKADADMIRAASTRKTSSAGITYYTGKMTILGGPSPVQYHSQYYTMSEFSSWGVPGDLTLKPEITAPGGNIYSLYGESYYNGSYYGGHDQYELMSGTSMAAPAITGMVALVSQYLRESGLAEQEGMKLRTLAQSLLMSTAEPLYEEASGGNYYSLLNQGAGMGRVDLATAADSYILVDGQPDGKVKAELGDDPNRTGVYEFSFSINNLSGEEEDYVLSADLFCQDNFEYQPDSQVYLLDTWTKDLDAIATFTVNGREVTNDDLSDYDLNNDGRTDVDDADYLLEYLLGNETLIYGQKDVNDDGMVSTYDAHVLLALLKNTGGMVTVPANGSVTVNVKLTLTAESKAMLNAGYENGTYVEAFVYAESIADEEGVAGTVHSIPVLAFYGNWSDATMFDHGTYIELLHTYMEHVPYLYQVVGCGNSVTIDYGDGEEYYFGGNPFILDDVYMPERNAFNSQDASRLVAQYYSLIRLASDVEVTIRNADTGEVYFSRNLGMNDPAYYFVNYGSWENYQQRAMLNWTGKGADGRPLPQGTNVEVVMRAVPEYYRNADGSHNYAALGEGAYMTTWMTIDNTAPEMLELEQVGTTLKVTVQDNEYVAAVAVTNTSGTSVVASANPNQAEKGVPVTAEVELEGVMGKNFLLVVYDYAGNARTYEISPELPEPEREYFTAIDCNTNDYVGVNYMGTVTHMISSGLPLGIRAAEYVGGYVFSITEDNSLCVADDDDLGTTIRIAAMDPDRMLLITFFNDMAYNRADGKLYGLFYSQLNYEMYPYLCTIDMNDGSIEVICEMPEDVNTLAIDTNGRFYSAGYNSSYLYTYTLADVTSANPSMTYVGQMGYYVSSTLSSMAWDHNTGKLYWAYPNTLLEIDTKTATPKLLGYQKELLVGLYTRPEQNEDMFAPVDYVDRVELNLTDTRAMVDNNLKLEATVWPWNASDRSVTWNSSNPAVATVDANGVVRGISAGTAVITVASRLDPTKKETCTVTVEPLPDKTLNGLVWDVDGQIWMSEFGIADLPNYTKLSADLGNALASATMGQDGVIYAASLDAQTLKSSLYKLDPQTYEPTFIGPSYDGYVDLAPAPSLPGKSLAAAYGGNVLLVDATTGDYYEWFNLFTYNVVGIAYVGSQPFTDWGYNTTVDWYFIIDRMGYVYLLGFLEQDGAYYYLEHDQLAPGGIYTELGFEMDTGYFGSAYFDGEFLYFSAYKETWNNVTLMAIDVASDSRICYTLGTFADGVWPVAGLMELDLPTLPDYMSVEMASQPKAAEKTELVPLETSDAKTKTAGGLNAVSGSAVVPQSSGRYEDTEEQIIVELTNVGTAPNGKMTVDFDPETMTFTGITGHTEAFAFTVEEGRITVAFAAADELPEDTVIATVHFAPRKSGEQTITIIHSEARDEPCGMRELVTVNMTCDHSYETVVTEPTCQAGGYTTYTCSKCGDSYVADYTDPVKHVYEENGPCKWCGTRWVTATTSLNGTIDLNIYVALSQELLNDPDVFIRFTRGGVNVDIPVSEGIESVRNKITCYRYTCEIFAKQVADTVTIQVMKGDEIIGTPLEYSVMRYCVNQIKNSSDEKLIAVCKSMLNYAAAAQLSFNYNTDNLANASLSEADKVLPEVDASAYKFAVTGSEEGIKARTATLMLESVVKIRVYFQLTGDKSFEDYTFTIDGKEVELQQNSSGYYIETEGIPAKHLEQMHEFSVGGLTVRYGALSYVNSKITSSTAPEAEKNISKALFAYWQAAESFLG